MWIHDLALALWSTGNHDARVLSTMIADPARATAKLIDAWSRDLDCYQLTDALATFVALTRHAARRLDRWTKSKNEWIGRAGWKLVVARTQSADPDAFFVPFVARIDGEVDTAPNRVRQR